MINAWIHGHDMHACTYYATIRRCESDEAGSEAGRQADSHTGCRR
jgi:hypothetical protein